jgi:MoxR-like ATPase
MKVVIGYPSAAEEVEIVRRMGVDPPRARRVLDAKTVVRLQAGTDQVFVHHAVVDYAVRLVFATRDPATAGLGDLAPLLAYGASPRATLGLVAAGRALAVLRGRTHVLPQDVYDIAPEVLRHRLVLSYDALADGVDADAVTTRVLTTVTAPKVAPLQEGGDEDEAAWSAQQSA